MTAEYAPLRLKKNEERRLRAGHLWVFSNEVDVAATPLPSFEPGQAVEIQDARGRALGTGYVNPNSLICARLVSRDAKHPFDGSYLVHRLKVALSLRERLYAEPFYRLVYGEGDGLPGLVIDRFDDVYAVQITTAGMEVMLEAVLAALDKVVKPRAVLLRNDSPVRKLEGLDLYTRAAVGEVPDEITVPEFGAQLSAPLAGGQKTGWFYDQRDNRALLGRYVQGARVLDVFSYVGGWGIQAVRAGAESAVCVDNSSTALDYVEKNARDNGIAERIGLMEGDAFEALRALREERERFDVVIVDPPAFIKRKKDIKSGIEGYRRINQMALQVLERDGFLISCSCSHHLKRDVLVQQMNGAARHVDRSLQVLAHGYQSADHPMNPAIPETEYLKAVFARAVNA
jgi:23S rRNA (cytosine1962-C5)-methyltransferase